MKKQPTEGLRKLLEDSVADMYYAEKKLVKATLKMSKAAVDESLVKAIKTHHEETKGQVAVLEKVFAMLGKAPKGKKCEAIDGIVKEGDGIMDEFKGDAALDAAIVAAAQKAEHYEIASYGTMVAFAQQLGLKDVAKALSGILAQEKNADQSLSALAENTLNAAA